MPARTDKCTDCNKRFNKNLEKTPRYNRCVICQRQRFKIPGQRKKKILIADLTKDPNIRPVAGFKGRYLVSNTGDVYSVTEGYIRKLRAGINASGYYLVCLFENGKPSMKSVHRLVASAFIENKYPYINKIINHIDGNKLNNNVDNLEWCTFKHNTSHALRTGLQPKGEEIATAKLNDEKVQFIYYHKRRKNDTRRDRLTQDELAQMFGVTSRVIGLVQNSVVWKHVPRLRTKPPYTYILNSETNEYEKVDLKVRKKYGEKTDEMED